MLETRNRVEIDAMTFGLLMHDLTLAGVNEPASNGVGWAGTHPVYGAIEVARIIDPPGYAYREPSWGYFVTGSPEITARILREVQKTPQNTSSDRP